MAITDLIKDIADAIRTKRGETDLMRLDEMPDKITGISGRDYNFWCKLYTEFALSIATKVNDDYYGQQFYNYMMVTQIESIIKSASYEILSIHIPDIPGATDATCMLATGMKIYSADLSDFDFSHITNTTGILDAPRLQEIIWPSSVNLENVTTNPALNLTNLDDQYTEYQIPGLASKLVTSSSGKTIRVPSNTMQTTIELMQEKGYSVIIG